MLATALLFIAPSLPALPQEDEGFSRLREQATFARALSNEFGFYDLADQVIERALAKATARGDRDELMLARCDLKKASASRTKDLAERLQAWGEAGSAFVAYLASEPDAAHTSLAQTGLGEIAYQYGSTLKDYLETADPVGDERDKMLDTAENIFMVSLQGTNALISWWKSLPDGDEKNGARFSIYYPSEFYRALIYYYWALLYPADSPERDLHSGKAIAYLEDFAMLSGGSSVATHLAYRHMGDIYTIRQEFEDGESYYQYVIDEAVPSDQDVLDNISPTEIERRQGLVQEAYLGYLNLLTVWGKPDLVAQQSETFQAWVEDEGILLNPSGYRVLLSVARSQVSQGDYSNAIQMAEQVARENEQSVLRLEANAVMMEAIRNAPSDANINLDVIFGAAQGAYYQERYQDAILGLHLLLGRIEGHRRQEEFGPRTYYFLGRSWSKSGATLESAVSHQAGFELFPIEDDEYTLQNAKQWRILAQKFRDANPGDSFLDSFYGAALEAEKTAGGSTPDAALWHAAKGDYDLAKAARRAARGADLDSKLVKDAIRAYEKAIRSYSQIEVESTRYERAVNQIGVCYYEMCDFDPSLVEESLNMFANYLDEFVTDPSHTPIDAAGRKVRKDMTAQADFYLGRCWRKKAKAGVPNAWEEVRDQFDGYSERHPGQIEFASTAIYYRLEAFIALGSEAQAIQAFEMLQQKQASPRTLQSGAFLLYRDYISRSDTSEGRERIQLRSAGTKYLHLANQAASSPSWQNLVTEANLRLELGEPATCQKILEGVLRDFVSDSSFKGSSAHFYAELALVDAYLQQDNTGSAASIIDRLLASNPSNLKVMQAAVKIKVGYPIVRDGRIVQIPGQATDEAFTTAQGILTNLLLLAENDAKKQNINKYKSVDYWNGKMMQAYLLYSRAQIDSTYRGKHKTLIDGIRRLADDFGREVAGDDIADIFNWLSNQG